MLRMENVMRIGLLVFAGLVFLASQAGAYYVEPDKIGAPEGLVCVTCHREVTPGIYNQWRESTMGQAGVNCYDCHRAEKGDPDAFEHKEMIAVVVTPKDCGKCHEKEFKEYSSSYHADAIKALDNVDNFFGRAAWGDDDRTGCAPCHGTVLKMQEGGQGKLEPATWPNTGIGRINLDGSKGSCTACHSRHIFSLEQARRPETCGRCHIGPENPQLEVYMESKHGGMYAAYQHKMNLDRRNWRAGQDFFQGPTCAACHMGTVPPQPAVKDADQRLEEALRSVLSEGEGKDFQALLPPPKGKQVDHRSTHDVGTRLSWNLRQPVSKKTENWEQKRQLMQRVCFQCHGENFIEQFYIQFDGLVMQYNTRFALPATRIRDDLIKSGKLTKENYDEPLDRHYWKLVGHEGHRARQGAAMAGPNYAWSEGMQEVAERFYLDFVPEVEKILGGKAEKFMKKRGYVAPQHKQ